ncbi:chromosome partitioning protein [Paraoerskovia sediminicola]|uniref:Chromosome partitioning protein n=1 Tax=Paraoerskovia sediminicola TaxID=1138587 RepID=A0ABN6XF70_9CELL|nr:polysaccharide biosynthesis tyrosine autokinase [Paraoerskovia sediminicola]BDZ42738.1 chromosome partitioning protein [Paraoerskovia sediminicola]
MRIGEYISMVRAHWIALTVFCLVGGAAAIALVSATTPLYTARVEVVVVTSSGDTANELVQSYDFSQKQVRTFSALVTRPIVLDPVISELDLEASPEDLAKQISVSSPLNTSLISIDVEDPSAEEAADVANATAQNLALVVGDLVPDLESGDSSVTLETVRPAVVPEVPSSPKTLLWIALGLVGGAVAGVTYIALREIVDTRVRDLHGVTAVVDAPVLGSVAHERRVPRHPLLDDPSTSNQRAEAFRQIRTNLTFLEVANERVLLPITSSVPGEGKSTTAANIAQSLAAGGSRVVLVEADLRRPALGPLLGLESMAGLTTVLAARAELDDVIQHWGTTSLDIVLAGERPPNPSELLGSDAMLKLLGKLSKRYDKVVIDCPPLVPVTDAAVIARACGGAVLVAGAGRVKRADLQQAVSNLKSVGAPIIGVVANDLAPKNVSTYAYAYDASGAMDDTALPTSRDAEEPAVTPMRADSEPIVDPAEGTAFSRK